MNTLVYEDVAGIKTNNMQTGDCFVGGATVPAARGEAQIAGNIDTHAASVHTL